MRPVLTRFSLKQPSGTWKPCNLSGSIHNHAYMCDIYIYTLYICVYIYIYICICIYIYIYCIHIVTYTHIHDMYISLSLYIYIYVVHDICTYTCTRTCRLRRVRRTRRARDGSTASRSRDSGAAPPLPGSPAWVLGGIVKFLPWDKWEVLLGIRLLGTSFGCGLSCQTIRLPMHRWALDKQSFHWGSTDIVECRPPLRALPPFSYSVRMMRMSAKLAEAMFRRNYSEHMPMPRARTVDNIPPCSSHFGLGLVTISSERTHGNTTRIVGHRSTQPRHASVCRVEQRRPFYDRRCELTSIPSTCQQEINKQQTHINQQMCAFFEQNTQWKWQYKTTQRNHPEHTQSPCGEREARRSAAQIKWVNKEYYYYYYCYYWYYYWYYDYYYYYY